ncbi:MAG TPA: ABC transporter permease [Bryobacteraceae bacterium]|nr:ABC transporter permease [Bryobacteraceae bacterium]
MHDLRYAVRLIRQNWGFSLTVIAILALCIGANTGVLAVVNGAMVRPLPYPEPDRLAQIVAVFRFEGKQGTASNLDGTIWEAIRDHASALNSAVYSYGANGVNLGVNGTGIYVKQQRVSSGFFQVLGVRPMIGREFTADEDRKGGPPAVILSHALWQRYFHGDAGVAGRGILLRGEPYTVVGIMPAGFRSDATADLWTPIQPSRTGEGGGTNYHLVGRLRPGATWQEASGQLGAITAELKRQRVFHKDSDALLDIIPLLEGRTTDLREPLMLLSAAVGFVFILGCVNIGGMLLARSSGRVGEIATRLALGAPFSRIVRQLLIESTVLGLLGGLAGTAVGWGALAGLRNFGSMTFPFLETVEMDWRVLASTLFLTLVAGVGFGLAPAWQATRVDLRSAQSGSRGVAGRKRFLSLGALVGGQVALTVPLLFGAGLFLHTFLHLWNLNPGFDPNHVMTARFSLADARYQTAAQMMQFYDKVFVRLHETPGIEAAAAALSLPYERALNDVVKVPGIDRKVIANLTYVTPEYFTALRVPLLRGRAFSAADSVESAKVCIVNQAFVNRYLKKGDALGQPLSDGMIVGIAGDVLEARAGWGDAGPVSAVPEVYIPAAQANALSLLHTYLAPSWIVRSSLDGAQVTKAIEDATRSADPMLPMAAFRSVRDLKVESLTFERFLAVLAGAIAALAMVLSAMGIYGLIANLVTERTKELGIRMALGSGVGQAIQVALRPGLMWVLCGVAAGTVAALGFERFLKSYLWGVQPGDPLTLAGVGLGLLLATALASLIPAARIARLNPADTLRSE